MTNVIKAGGLEVVFKKTIVETAIYKILHGLIKASSNLLDNNYTDERVITILQDRLGDNGIELIKRIDYYPSLRGQILREVFDIISDDPSAVTHFLSQLAPTLDKDQRSDPIRVPKCFESLANVSTFIHGKTVGNGEVLAALLFGDEIEASQGKKYDMLIGSKPIHIKDHRNDDSSFISSARSKDHDDVDWRETDVFRFIAGCDLPPRVSTTPKKIDINRFGSDDLRDNAGFEAKVCQKYGIECLDTAATRFQVELDDSMRNSSLVGAADVFLILKRDEQGLYYQFVGKNLMHFYSTTCNGQVKMTEKKDRYYSAIMSRTRKHEKSVKKAEDDSKKKELKLQRLRDFKAAYDAELSQTHSSKQSFAKAVGARIDAIKLREKRLELMMKRAKAELGVSFIEFREVKPWVKKRDKGVDPIDSCKEMLSVGLDLFARIRLLRVVYGLSLEDAKRIDLRASGLDDTQQPLIAELEAIQQHDVCLGTLKHL